MLPAPGSKGLRRDCDTLCPPALRRAGVFCLKGDASRLEVGCAVHFYAGSGTLENGGLSRQLEVSPDFWGDSCALAQQQRARHPRCQASRERT